jgi:ABC-type uncharacterized transport system ATPase subunit
VETRTRRGHAELILAKDTPAQAILEHLMRQGTAISHFEAAAPSLNGILLKALEGRHE